MRSLRPFALMLVVVLATPVVANAQERQRVKGVIDGDTIVLQSGEHVQLIGVRTPKTKRGANPAEPFGEEAYEFTKRLVEGKEIRLEIDPRAGFRDKHSRILAYVFLWDETFVNAEIIRAGYGRALHNTQPLRYEADFIRLEMMARRHRRGIWAQETKGK